MKNFLISFLLLSYTYGFSQVNPLPVVYLNENVSTHFVSKLNIDYTDLSTHNVVGDNPMKNIVRMKPKGASNNLGVATIVGENFFLQFRLEYTSDEGMAHTQINLDSSEHYQYPALKSEASSKTPSKIANYNNPNYTMSHIELEEYAKLLEPNKPSLHNVVSKEYKMKMKLNNIWVVGEYLFFDYSIKNKANIPYTVDETRFKIVDTKLVKATSNQDRLLRPDYELNKNTFIHDDFRNIVAFKKFTFPNDKSFNIVVAEDQISGRKITLPIAYSDILEAKSFKTKGNKKTASTNPTK